MARRRITFRVAAWNEILTSPGAQAAIADAANRIADEANSHVEQGDPGEAHFVVKSNITKTGRPSRARAVVIAASYEAREAEVDRQALTRSAAAGRLR